MSVSLVPASNDSESSGPSPLNFAWLDLEMTGLDVTTEVILQAALIITNSELKILEEYSCDIWQPESALAGMTPFVRDMHTKTGLIERVRNSRVDVGDAERRLMAVLTRWCTYPATLCGNSIWADRRFVDKYMPGLSGFLHYRMVDVSSLKVLAARWYEADAQFAKPLAGAHDAVVDVRNSIAELKHYRQSLFRPAPVRSSR
ncbi:MAG: hypothetical protein RJA70_4187 [Pseudomonadota bacterium]|jgi:oligoribonuclease